MSTKNKSNKNKKYKAGYQPDHRPPNKMPNSVAHRNPQFLLLLGAAFMMVMAVLLAYSNSYSGVFIYDDIGTILDNPTILHLPPQNFLTNLNGAAAHVAHSRPVTNWTFAFNYALGGLNPFGYHVFNVLMHLCSSLFVFGIIRRTLLSKPLKDRWGDHALLLSLAIALLWAVHPLQTNAIDYITQRLESLAGFFYLATLYCLIRGGEPKKSMLWLSIGVLAAFLGMGSKETMVTAPVVLLLYDRAFLAGGFKEALTKRAGFYVGLVLAWVFLAILLSNGHNASIGVSQRGVSSNVLSYAATQLGVVLHYLKLTVWPNPLILDNYWPVANTLNAILWPGLAVVSIAGLTLWGFIKNRPWAMIGLWFFIILSPSSSFIPIGDEYVNEYRMYLPVLAPITLLTMGLYAGLQQAVEKCLSKKMGGLDQITNLIFASILVAAVIAFGLTTYERNKDYSSEDAMWLDNINKTLKNPRIYNTYGEILGKRGETEKAIENFTKAIDLYPDYFIAHTNLGVALIQQGKLDAGISELKHGLALNPNYQLARNNLQIALNLQALYFSRAGNRFAAIEKLKEVLAINPGNVDAKRNLAILTGK